MVKRKKQSSFDGFSFEFLSASSLGIDSSYQRPLCRSFVKMLAEAFNPYCFQPLLVGQRKDSSLWIVDGQQHGGAAELCGITHIPCMIFPSDGPKHEAAIWNIVNTNRRSPNPVDRYLASLTSGDVKTWEIQEILERHGFCVSQSSVWMSFRCTKPLYDARSYGVLDGVLGILYASFKDSERRMQKIACQAIMLGSLAVILKRWGSEVDENRLQNILSAMAPGPWKALESGSAGPTGNRAVRVAEGFIIQYYNKGLRTKKLEVVCE